MQTVQFNHWEYRPSNCDAIAAAAAAADCDAGDVDDGQTLDALECRPRRLDKACRPSDSMIKSTDCQIVVLLLLLPLLLMAMLVVMMMPTAPTLVFMILSSLLVMSNDICMHHLHYRHHHHLHESVWFNGT